jgi:nitrite reductase/ring-hydroxylating ferredoxin subunit
MIIKRNFYAFCLAILVLLLISCKKEYVQVPEVYVNIALDLNDPDFFSLNSANNGVEITGGYAGIIIFRQSSSKFVAFDRACPNDPYKEKVHISERGNTAIDTLCGSEFSLIFDGNVMSGPAPYPLKQYTVSYNDGSGIVYIFN